MTRIGFAYNQKPELSAGAGDDQAEVSRPEEEPPSTCRGTGARHFESPAVAKNARHAGDAGASQDVFAEWDSSETIDAVADALSALGEVIRLEADADFPLRLREQQPDIVFNIAEGLQGRNREAHVPAICEFFDIPYSGSDPFTLSLCLDKARAKQILTYHGIPTAPFALVESEDDVARLALGAVGLRRPSDAHPLFVKPVHEGSSKGITERNLVRSPRELEAVVRALITGYDEPVIVEEFLPGPEFTCGVLGNGDGAWVLPLVGLNFDALPAGAAPIYGFEAKWVWDRPERPLAIFACPASVPESLREEIEAVVLRAYRALGCRDWSRVDVRLDEHGVANIVEVNPLPGILPNPADNSCLPKAARAAGIGYDELIQRCLLHAAERSGVSLARPARSTSSYEAVA